MCLYAHQRTSQEFKKNHSGQITVWKVYRKFRNRLYSSIFKGKPIRSGTINSNRQTTRFPISDEHKQYDWPFSYVLYKGIHVFLTRKAARIFKSQFRERHCEVVVKCTANMKDFVACDSDTSYAIFTKIHISPEEMERGKKNRN